MQYLLVAVGVLGACGGSSNGSVDAPGGDASQQTAFCDGSVHDVGPGILNGLAVDGTGRLVGVGTSFTPSQAMFVGRWLATGAPDAGFGAAGIARLTTSGVADGHAVLVRADHTIVAGGGMEAPTDLKPFVIGLDDAGAPTGWTLSDPASPDSTTELLFEQGTALLEGTRDQLRRVTAAGAFDAAFTDVAVSGGITATDSGLAAAVPQLDSFETYRLTPDGMNQNSTVAMASVSHASSVATAISHGDRITFVGTTVDDALVHHTIVGRVLANNTFDTAAYPPAGVADLGDLGDPSYAVERADGSLLLAADPIGIVVVKPDGTVDRTMAVGTDPSKLSIYALADWNGHPTAAGTLAGGRAFIACF